MRSIAQSMMRSIAQSMMHSVAESMMRSVAECMIANPNAIQGMDNHPTTHPTSKKIKYKYKHMLTVQLY